MALKQGKDKRTWQDPSSRRLPFTRRIYHGWRRVAYSWPALILIAFVVVTLISSTLRVYARWDLAREARNQASARLIAEQKREQELKNNLERLSTPIGEEEELRSNYQVAKPGEGVIILVGTSSER